MLVHSAILGVTAVVLVAGARLAARRRRPGAGGLIAAAVGLIGFGLGWPIGRAIDQIDSVERTAQQPFTTAEVEHKLITTLFPNGAIQTAPPDDRAVCHDWTFGGTRYTDGCPVATLLADFRPIAKPRPGDVVVYWSPANEPVHSGIVRAVGSEGMVVIESKWGRLGRYLHLADVTHFPSRFTYFRHAGDQGTVTAGNANAAAPANLAVPDSD
jgi:hypothetical protein